MTAQTPSLAPSLLLSMPQLMDPNFNRTVVLLCRHSEEGAFGLVVNRPVQTAGRIHVGPPPGFDFEGEFLVWIGGPVEQERSWVLVGLDAHGAGQPGEAGPAGGAEGAGQAEAGEPGRPGSDLFVADGLTLSTSADLVRRLFEPDPPRRAKLVVGYSGWGAGQLEQELAQSAWLLSDVDPSLIFDVDPDRMWETAIRRLGVDPHSLQLGGGVH